MGSLCPNPIASPRAGASALSSCNQSWSGCGVLAAGMQRVGYAPKGGPANTMPLSSRDQLNRHNFNAP